MGNRTVIAIFWLTTWIACCGTLVAQSRIKAVQNEEDVIQNSVVQAMTGTNGIMVGSPLVPAGTATRPIIYNLRCEIIGGHAGYFVCVTFDDADQFQIFDSIKTEQGTFFQTAPYMQQELQGRKDVAYVTKLADDYAERLAKTGAKWSFKGPKHKTRVEIPAFFFSGFEKHVAEIQQRFKPSAVNDSLVYSGSIGKTTDVQEPAKQFYKFSDVVGETFLFSLPGSDESRFGYSLKITDPAGRVLGTSELSGRETRIISVTFDENGEPVFAMNIQGVNGICMANCPFFEHLFRGMVLKSAIQTTKTNLSGRTLWLKTDRLLTYNALNQSSESHVVKRLQPVTVERVALGGLINPTRLILKTTTGDTYFQEYREGQGLLLDKFSETFDALFYTEDPRKTYNWPDEDILLIEQSNICVGMTAAEVIAAWGQPEKIIKTVNEVQNLEKWKYGKQDVFIRDGKYIEYHETQ